MKKGICFLLLSFVFASCSVTKKPIFLKVDDIKIVSFKADTIHLQAKAHFKNENDVGGKISTEEIKVIVNDVEVANVSSEPFKVPANKEFYIPLKVHIPTKKVFENNSGGLLNTLLGSVLNKSIKVQFKGDIKYKVFGFSSTYSVDKTENINIKL